MARQVSGLGGCSPAALLSGWGRPALKDHIVIMVIDLSWIALAIPECLLNSPSSMGPVLTVGEPDGPGGGVGPSHQLVSVIHNTSSPEEPLGILMIALG